MSHESALAKLEWSNKSRIFALKIENDPTRSTLRCVYGAILGRTGSTWRIRVIFDVERTNGSTTVEFQEPSGKDQEIEVEDGLITKAKTVEGTEEGLKQTVQQTVQQQQSKCYRLLVHKLRFHLRF